MDKKKAAIVLAAGKGKRMKSDLPKVLHRIHNRPLINILLDTLVTIGFEKIVVVVGYKGEMVEEALSGYPVSIVWQKEQNGTGHAVMMAEPQLTDFEGTTLVALGDVPFLSVDSVAHLFKVHHETEAVATCLSAILDDPTGYGRIVRDGNSSILKDIVEHKDASEEILKIKEINSGTFCYDNRILFDTLKKIDNRNVQGEYYLTDTIKIMHNRGLRVSVVAGDNADELAGVNSIEQLKKLEEKLT